MYTHVRPIIIRQNVQMSSKDVRLDAVFSNFNVAGLSFIAGCVLTLLTDHLSQSCLGKNTRYLSLIFLGFVFLAVPLLLIAHYLNLVFSMGWKVWGVWKRSSVTALKTLGVVDRQGKLTQKSSVSWEASLNPTSWFHQAVEHLLSDALQPLCLRW